MKTDTVSKPSILVWWALAALASVAFCGCQHTPIQAGVTWEHRPDQDRAAYLVWNVTFAMSGSPPEVGWVDVAGRGDECEIRDSAAFPDRSTWWGWKGQKPDGSPGCVNGLTFPDDPFTQVAVDDRFGVLKFYQTAMPHEFCHLADFARGGDGDRNHTGRCETVDYAPAPGGKMALAYELLVQEDL